MVKLLVGWKPELKKIEKTVGGILKSIHNTIYSMLSSSLSLNEYTSKFVFVALLLAILAAGCIGVDDDVEDANITEPALDKYEEYSNVDRILVDMALAEDPVEFANNTGWLAEAPEDFSFEKPIAFHKGTVRISLRLKSADTPIPEGYDITESGRSGDLISALIPPRQILKLSKEPDVAEISLPDADDPGVSNFTFPLTPDVYNEYSSVDEILVDLALAEKPVEVARSTDRLAESLQEVSVEKDVVFEKDRVLVLTYLNGVSASFPDGYDVIEFGRLGDIAGVWIPTRQILKLSKEPEVRAISLPEIGAPGTTGLTPFPIHKENPNVDFELVDVVVAKHPIVLAWSNSRLANRLEDVSPGKPFVFEDDLVLISVYLKDIDTRFPDSYNVTDFGRLGDVVGVWILPDQILNLSKEPEIRAISLPIIGTPVNVRALPPPPSNPGEYGKYPNVDHTLVDIALAEDPVEAARRTGRLAETFEQISFAKPIVIEEGRVLVSVYLVDADTSLPEGYDIIKFGGIGDVAEVWILSSQILEISKEPNVRAISIISVAEPGGAYD